ncbi:hypothetical protein ACFFX0_31550 [Citricoccus parietis]|uniref:Uncharacterized protein n=1 Tax=Citricoccus parietis TaxID=592307 RepID=A0ABV5G995_9MICC
MKGRPWRISTRPLRCPTRCAQSLRRAPRSAWTGRSSSAWSPTPRRPPGKSPCASTNWNANGTSSECWSSMPRPWPSWAPCSALPSAGSGCCCLVLSYRSFSSMPSRGGARLCSFSAA